MPTFTYNGGTVFTPAPENLDIATQSELDAVAAAKQDASTAATDAELAAHAADTTAVHGIADTAALVTTDDSRLSDSRAPIGSAGGVLSGTYPNPSFAADMATQAELETVRARVPGSSTVGLAPRRYGTVLSPTAAAWDAYQIEGPSVWWDENAQRWGMVYVGYSGSDLFTTPTDFGRIGLAWSSDLLTWTKDAANPIFDRGAAGQPDDGSVTAPFMYYEGGTYYLFYTGCSDPGYEQGTKTLMLASAAATATGPPTSNASWTRHGSISPGSPPSWCSDAIWHPNVVKVDSTYHLFINGTAADTKERIGHATASSLTGPWTYDANAVLDVGTAGAFDDSHVADPYVYRLGDFWYMHYAGVDSNLLTKEGLAWTTNANFPTGWTKHAQNPQLSVWTDSSFGGVPNYTGGRPCIVTTDHAHYHFYTANWPGRIELAIVGGDGFETVAGARRRPWQASDNLLLLASMDPANANGGVGLSDGYVALAKIWVPETTLVASMIINIVVAGVGLTSGRCLGGLYKSDGTLIAKTATQHATWNTTGPKTMALTAEANQSLRIEGGPGRWIYGALLASGTGTDPQAAGASGAATSAVNINMVGDATNGWRSAYEPSGGTRTTLPSTLSFGTAGLSGPMFIGLI